MGNRLYFELDGISENENFARVMVASFASRMEPTLEEVSDIKTAVSEAVTNAVIHGYGTEYRKRMGQNHGLIVVECLIEGNLFTVIVRDFGVGIADVNYVRQALVTTALHEERSGMGFTFMEMFMDEVLVSSSVGKGTTVIMKKRIGGDDIEGTQPQ